MTTVKGLKKGAVGVAILCVLGLSVAIAQENDLDKSPEVTTPSGTVYSVPKGQKPIPINYDGQPVLIPHSVEYYQTNIQKNDCLMCHNVDSKTATPVSATHLDKKKQLQADRYLCLACHVQQTDAPPIVDNKF